MRAASFTRFSLIATVHLEIHNKSSFSSIIRTSQTIVECPLCIGVPIAVTIPSFFERMWFALISRPKQMHFS